MAAIRELPTSALLALGGAAVLLQALLTMAPAAPPPTRMPQSRGTSDEPAAARPATPMPLVPPTPPPSIPQTPSRARRSALQVEPVVRRALEHYRAVADDWRQRIPLEADRLEQLMQLAGTNPSRRDARAYAERLRGLGTEDITPEALQRAVDAFREEHPPEEEAAAIEDAWSVVDSDGDGVLRGDELPAMLNLLMTKGEPLSMEETKDFLEVLDADADGDVTQDEFMRMMEGPFGLLDEES